MSESVKHFFRSATDWLFRRPSPGLLLVRFGFGCLALTFGAGWILNISMPYSDGQLDINVNQAGSVPTIIVYFTAIIGILLIATGAVWEINRYRAERKRLSKKKVIVIETRGLRDTSGTPLVNAIPNTLEGQRESLLIDLRQRIKDGVIVSPDSAIEDLTSLPVDLKRRENGLDRHDITIAYGGLTPVPLTFLTGVLIDDEGPVTTFDWDRHGEKWRLIEGSDDGKRFSIDGLENVSKNTSEVALAISVSYSVNLEGIHQKVGDIMIIHLELEDGNPDCHWSDVKQRAIGQQFLETVIALNNLGVKCIHLFVAAQNSVIFRFGRLYDKRNLPAIIVYQYQQEAKPPYPWGILIPVSGIEKPRILVDH